MENLQRREELFARHNFPRDENPTGPDAISALESGTKSDADTVVIDSPPTSFYSELEKKQNSVLKRYKELVSELTKEEELEVLGISFSKAFPPIDRDVEKLVVDINVIIFRYMQLKMENDAELRAETVRSTVQSALRKVASLAVSGE